MRRRVALDGDDSEEGERGDGIPIAAIRVAVRMEIDERGEEEFRTMASEYATKTKAWLIRGVFDSYSLLVSILPDNSLSGAEAARARDRHSPRAQSSFRRGD